MAALLDCPATESWQALFTGTVPPELREAYEHHLVSCPTCQARLDQTETDGAGLLQLARQLGDPTQAPPDASLVQAIGGLLQALPANRGAPDPADLYFLRPTDRPGVLGLLGPYEVRAILGQGGMGLVLQAFDPALDRLVALKVLTPVLAGSATARRRFIREAQAAAAVNHEHIVPVHGVHEADGLPYLVMQLIEGESLQARLDRTGPLPVEEIVRIGLQTARGLAAAHAQGLVHRDIKPANILLESRQGDKETRRQGDKEGLSSSPCLLLSLSPCLNYRVKITDFGLARLVDDIGLTQNGVVAGTPEYMAPEQARGEPVDHRADQFSLGSVLYALCTGVPPFRGATPLAVLRQVSDEEAMPLRLLNPHVPAWLEAVITRLLARDRAERFPSMTDLAQMLEDYLTQLQQPQPAWPPEPPERSRVRKAKGGPGPLVFLFLALGLGLGLIPLGMPGCGSTPQGPAANGAVEPVRRLHGHTGPVTSLRFTPDGRRLVSGSGWPGKDCSLRVWDPATGEELRRITTPGLVSALDISRDGRFALAGLNNGPVLLLDLENGRVVKPYLGHGKAGVSWVAFASDGRHQFSASKDGTARMLNLEEEKEVQTFRVRGKWARLGAEFPDGRRLLTADDSGLLQVWDLGSGQEVKRLPVSKDWISSLTLLPDGRHVLVGTGESLWDLETGQRLRSFPGHEGEVKQMSVSPDGRWLLTASFDGTVRLWDFAGGELLHVLCRQEELVYTAVFSPDSKRIAASGGGRRQGNTLQPGSDHAIRLWDLPALLAEATTPPRAARNGGLVVVVILFLIAALTLAGVWGYLRRGRRASGVPTPPSGTRTQAVVLDCSGCGKKLKIRPGLAGKKVLCPQCGQAIVAP